MTGITVAALRGLVLFVLLACSACTPVRDETAQLAHASAGVLDLETPPIVAASVLRAPSVVAFRYEDMLAVIVFLLVAMTAFAYVLLGRKRTARTMPIL